jgi:hypothetical protein
MIIKYQFPFKHQALTIPRTVTWPPDSWMGIGMVRWRPDIYIAAFHATRLVGKFVSAGDVLNGHVGTYATSHDLGSTFLQPRPSEMSPYPKLRSNPFR